MTSKFFTLPAGCVARANRYLHRVTLSLLLLFWLYACAGPPPDPPPLAPGPEGGAVTIYVVSNGWHSSIVIKAGDLPPGRIPETGDFPNARYLEFGWGDAEYYPAKDASVGMALNAALVPTPSVIHLVGAGIEPAIRYPRDEVIRVEISAAGLARLAGFIDATFRRGGAPRTASSGPGLYAASLFYPARGEFHLLNTCNTWTARALAAAGLAVTGKGTTRAEDLMVQVRALKAEQ
jgi:uncharacterized protein (TIGR02117 family)